MHKQITGRSMEITDTLREFIDSKSKKIEDHFSHIVSQANFILAVKKGRHIAECILTVKGGDVQAQAESSHMYASIEQLMDKLHRQLDKQKAKLKSHSGGNIKHMDEADEG